MTTCVRNVAITALLVAVGALLLPAAPATAYPGGGGYAGPPAGLSPGPSGGGFYPGPSLLPGLGPPYLPFRGPTLALPPWPLAIPMGEAGASGVTPDQMRHPYAGLALRDVGGGLVWYPVYYYNQSTLGLPASLPWPWWQYGASSGWVPSTCYSHRYVDGSWVPAGCW